MSRGAAALRLAMAALLFAVGLGCVVESYPHIAGIQHAVATVLGAALMGLGLVLAAFPLVLGGLRRWAVLVRDEWRR